MVGWVGVGSVAFFSFLFLMTSESWRGPVVGGRRLPQAEPAPDLRVQEGPDVAHVRDGPGRQKLVGYVPP